VYWSSDVFHGDLIMSWWRKEKRKSFSQRDRSRVWEDQFGMVNKGICPICRKSVIHRYDFQMGHVRSLKQGGTNDLSNIIPICAKCNLEAGAMDMRKYQKVYHARLRIKWWIAFGVIIGLVIADLVYSIRSGGIENSYTVQGIRLVMNFIKGLISQI